MLQTKALINQEHRVRTKLGVSNQSFKWTNENRIGGSGQGSGASMVNWHSFNEAIIQSYKTYMRDTRRDEREEEYRVRSFVDDNKLIFNFKGNTTPKIISNTLHRGLTTWRRLLRYTGVSCHYQSATTQW